MLGTVAAPGRVEKRRAQNRRLILDSAWRLAADSGLEALSLREIGAAVGMRAPSLYSYFPGKPAILDALFEDGYRTLDARIAEVGEALPRHASAQERLVALLGAWVSFCQADRARYQLLFTTAVPGWAPSTEAYAESQRSYVRLCGYLEVAGITDPDDVDLATALAAGLVAQQMANDPGGDRWVRRIDEVVDMFLGHVASRDEPSVQARARKP